jgi:hypothetical protein
MVFNTKFISGILGIGGGGAMVAGCMGPFFCTALSGQCCLVRRVISTDPVCPLDCCQLSVVKMSCYAAMVLYVAHILVTILK